MSILMGNAQEQQTPANIFDNDLPGDYNQEFQFLAFFLNQGVTSNFFPENTLLKGQVIGRLFGQNTTNTSNDKITMYAEQRLLPFFIYQPKLFNGKAVLRASFEIDWTWGDVAYGTGGNTGSAISADQVNIQTQNVELELIPAPGWMVNIGLQRLYDTPYNPYRATVDKMLETGYRLAYFGTDGVGLTVRHNRDYLQWKVGYYKLYESLIQNDDDVTLTEFSLEKKLSQAWNLGGSIYFMRDRANGAGGVSIFGQGLNATQLNAYNGTFKFNFGDKPYKANIFWLGTYFNRNADYMLDRWILSGFANLNLGSAEIKVADKWEKGADILGLGANLRGAYRYGQTINDRISLDFMYASGDDDQLLDKKYNGVITGNTWSSPGSVFIGSGAHILFPHGSVVNRFTPIIADWSNMGYGMTGFVFNASHDFVPNRFMGKVGSAVAWSNVEPLGGSKQIGTELNAVASYQFGPFMSLELHGAYVMLGGFFDSNDTRYGSDVNSTDNDDRPVDPWTAFLVFKWLMF
jgi:hypothetical protein